MRDGWSGICSMVAPSVEEGGPRRCEDMKIRGPHSHSPGIGGWGEMRLEGVIASDLREALRMDNLRAVDIAYYDVYSTNLDDFILNCEDFAEKAMAEM